MFACRGKTSEKWGREQQKEEKIYISLLFSSGGKEGKDQGGGGSGYHAMSPGSVLLKQGQGCSLFLERNDGHGSFTLEDLLSRGGVQRKRGVEETSIGREEASVVIARFGAGEDEKYLLNSSHRCPEGVALAGQSVGALIDRKMAKGSAEILLSGKRVEKVVRFSAIFSL